MIGLFYFNAFALFCYAAVLYLTFYIYFCMTDQKIDASGFINLFFKFMAGYFPVFIPVGNIVIVKSV